MTIKYIVLANSGLDLQNSLFYNKIKSIADNDSDIIIFNEDRDEDILSALLSTEIPDNKFHKIVFCLMFRAGDSNQRLSQQSIVNLWEELKNKNPDNDFVVLADSVPITKENPVVDILDVYPYFMLADAMLFAKEADSERFRNKICNATTLTIMLNDIKRFLKISLYELSDLDAIVCKNSEEDMSDADMNFWYQEADIKQVIIGELAARNLKVFQSNTETESLVLNADDTVYLKNNQTFTVCSELSIAQSDVANDRNKDIFRSALQQIMNLTVDVSQHSIVFPIYWTAKAHFCTGVLTVVLDRSNSEKPVLVNTGIKLTVLDTLYDGGCLDAVQTLLGPLVAEFCQEGVKLGFDANKHKITPQRDTSACGVIAVENILTMILDGEIVKSEQSITREEVAAMRRRHKQYIKPIEPRKPATNLYSLPAKEIDIGVLFENFNAYFLQLPRDKEIARFKAAAIAFLSCELISLKSNADTSRTEVITILDAKISVAKDKAQALVKDLGEDFVFTDFSLDDAVKKIGTYSNLLKEWFSKHETELRKPEYANLLDAIFKLKRDSDGDFEWASKDTDGRLNLVAVLERLFDLHLIEVKKPIPTLEIPSKNYMEHADDLLKIEDKIGPIIFGALTLESTTYKYSGTINKNGFAEGLGEEVSPELGYYYQGNFFNNRKAGRGIERHRLGKTNQFTEFFGKRNDATGKYETGSIRCFIGDPIIANPTLEYHLVLEARLQDGEIDGVAKVSVLTFPDFIENRFLQFEVVSDEIKVITHNMLEDTLNHLVSAVKYSINDRSLNLDRYMDAKIDSFRDLKFIEQYQKNKPSVPGKGFYPSQCPKSPASTEEPNKKTLKRSKSM